MKIIILSAHLHAEAFHVLGGQVKTTFDKLFGGIRSYGQSGGMEQLKFPEWK